MTNRIDYRMIVHHLPRLNLLLLCQMSSAAAETSDSNLYLQADAGTSHSPHGIGVSLGYKAGLLSCEAGVGLQSKNNLLGLPVSVSLIGTVNPYYILLGVTRFSGSGTREVRFESMLTTDDGGTEHAGTVDLEADVSWEIVYGRFGLGYILKQAEKYRFIVDAGFVRVLKSVITADLHADQTNLGEAKGIIIDKYFVYNSQPYHAGEDEVGLYIRFGINYEIL